MNTFQCYQILGVQKDTSLKEIKSAYRKLALQFHPDKNMSESDGKKFKEISEAYQFLRKEHKKNTNSQTFHYKNKSNHNSNNDFSKQHSWGARPDDRPPEQDWSKYTKHTERAYQDFWKQYEQAFWEYYEKVRSEPKVEPEPITEQKEISVSVNVDPGRCIACCSCETIAPSVFAVDKNVKVNPKSHVINENGSKFEKILDAAQTCPTKAISIKDKESDRRLYPW